LCCFDHTFLFGHILRHIDPETPTMRLKIKSDSIARPYWSQKMIRVRFVILLILFAIGFALPGTAQELTAGGRVSVSSDSGTVFDRVASPGGRITISSATTPLSGFDSYFATSQSSAGYGIVGASAGLDFTGYATRFGRQLGDARASADFEDTLTITAPGLGGQSGNGLIAITLSGSYSAGASEGISTSGGGRFRAIVNGEIGSVNDFDRNRTLDIPFQFVFGEPFAIEGSLDVNVTARAPANTSGASGSLSALFGNTAGITGLTVLGADMSPIDYSLSSASGAFEFYTPIPEPGTALLFGLGLIGLSSVRRRG
jgi:hypothetical protein